MSSVVYQNRQVLTLRDMLDEQAERIRRWREHALLHHGPGILDGLLIGDEKIKLGAGFDEAGRLIVLVTDLAVENLLKGLPKSDCLVLMQVSVAAQTGAWDAGRAWADRMIEECRAYRARMLAAPDGQSGWWLDPIPWPPVDMDELCRDPKPLVVWPNEKRQLAPLVAGQIDAPSGEAYVIVGADPEDERVRFAAGITRDGLRRDLIRIDLGQRTRIISPLVRATWRQREDDHRIHSATGIHFGVPIDAPAEASPSAFYKVKADREHALPQSLRVEIAVAADKGAVAKDGFAIVAERENRHFFPLSVSAAGRVRVTGVPQKPVDAKAGTSRTLINVRGAVREGPIRASLEDPRFTKLMLSASRAARLEIFIGKPDAGHSNRLPLWICNTGNVSVSGIQVYKNVFATLKPEPKNVSHLEHAKETDPEEADPRELVKVGEVAVLLPDTSRKGDGMCRQPTDPNHSEQHESFPPLSKALLYAEIPPPIGRPQTMAFLAYGSGPVGSIAYAIQGLEIEK